MSFFRWLRSNSEHYLLEAAQREMAKEYLGEEPPVRPGTLMDKFWRQVFVPIYRRIPWGIRRQIMMAMPGSHKRDWGGRAPKE